MVLTSTETIRLIMDGEKEGGGGSGEGYDRPYLRDTHYNNDHPRLAHCPYAQDARYAIVDTESLFPHKPYDVSPAHPLADGVQSQCCPSSRSRRASALHA